ncbi:lipopolysaccharide biosynthesis protein [Quadrisphaera sp. DSM 44207]|uniref:lipopolysaccharide biosynthesis protein n=1 Tax=Quadrisphaera sp. DSM 44207 TaxID=1881057 RepID=UPI000882E945|nr:lipopolysaccharide biosynthesis protein [Quadrisphaera sp. DSM 44207]SDQ68024.1 polysaccharide transporter, PST family [Quadrisphaera sp. DSM 44207]
MTQPSTDLGGGVPGTTLAEDDLAQQHPVLRRLQVQGQSIGAGARSGAVWAVGTKVGSQVLQFVGTVVTARLLVPSDYGVTAIVFPVIAFANILTSLGLGTTIIHSRRVTEKMLSTAFWINGVVGVVLTGVVAALSVPLSRFYDIPQLVPLLCLASLLFTINISLVPNSLLERTLRFKQLAVVEVVSLVLGTATTIVAAVLGAGAYSLVIGPLVHQVTDSSIKWAVVRWRPRALPDRASVRQFWTMSRGITGSQFLNFWSRNADNLLLGKFVPLAELGNYNRAYALMKLPVSQMNTMMGRVLFPALTRLRDDRPRLGRAWLRALSTANVVTAPIAIGMAVAAPAMIEVLFGPRWLGMVPVLQLLAVAALPQTLTTTVSGFLRAVGKSDTLFRLSLVTTAMSLVAIGAGLPWGAVGVAVALAAKFYLEVLVSLRPCLKEAALGWSDLARAMSGVWLATGALAAAGLAVRVWAGGHLAPWEELLAQVGAAGVAYVGVLALVDRGALRQAAEVLGAVRGRRSRGTATSGPAGG